MNNTPPSENAVLRQAVEQIQRCLPGHWSTTVTAKTNDLSAVRALVDGVPPFGVRRLAALAGTDPGYVSRLLDLFDREELLEREPHGPVVAVHRAALIRRWAEDYDFGEVHRALAFEHPHGVPGALAALRASSAPYALTGRAGAAALLGAALPPVVAAYVGHAERVAALIGATLA